MNETMIGFENLKQIKTNLQNANQCVKVNIHLRLSNEVKLWATNVNNKLTKGTNSEIVFGENSLMKPHQTLVVGELNDVKKLERMINVVKDVFKNEQPIKVKFKNLSVSENKNWAFLWAQENERICCLTNLLVNKLKKYITIKHLDKPHITLAKAENLYKNYNVLNDLNFPSEYVATFVDIALCGKNGTVLEILDSIELKQQN